MKEDVDPKDVYAKVRDMSAEAPHVASISEQGSLFMT
eukprot:gene18938-6293_t